MKAPEGWKDLNRTKQLELARDLLVWNCNQEVSDREHDQHFIDEIQPIHEEIQAGWDRYWARVDAQSDFH